VTTAGEIQTTPQDTPVRRTVTTWRRVVGSFVVGLALALAAAALALVALDASYEGRVLPGVHVGGTDLSGLDRVAAGSALQADFGAISDGTLVLETEAGDVSLSYSSFSRRLAVDAVVDEALHAGRAGNAAERAVGEVRLALWHRSLEPAVVLDEVALRSAVVRALGDLERRPVDAHIRMGPFGVLTMPARAGRSFDAADVAARALERLRRSDAPAEVRIAAPATAIAPLRGDDVVFAARESAERMIHKLVVTGRARSWTIAGGTIRTWIRFVADADGSVYPQIDEAAIPDALRKIARKVSRKPVSAEYLRSKGGTVVGVAAGKNGRRLDVDATTAAIVTALEARAAGVETKQVAAKLAVVEPKLTTAEAKKKAPVMVRLSSWKTYFPVGERNFWGANIWLPAKIIDGTVLRPGQRFEWWSALGPVTRARGFGLGGYIAGDHTDPTGAMGGGMCSASTTLFNAALRAGLDMGARDNHRYYIERYPLGLDATVSSAQTMSFTNDMKTSILIRGIRIEGSGGRGWVRFEIWGIDDGRTVSISKPAVRNVRKATTKVVYVNSLPHGVREQTEYPANGMDVAVTRTVRSRSGRLLHRETYRSPYQLWHGRIEVGR
jgi:vancomycin resistance protein YoaR